MAAATLEKKSLALGVLALPILGMIALFAWAGAIGQASSTSVVSSFITAYNARDCTAVTGDLYKVPGEVAPTCASLFGSTPSSFTSCSLATLPNSDIGPLAQRVPTTYSGVKLVRATCTRTVGGKDQGKIALDFLVANSPSGSQEIITVASG
jgi:hypothetical protein